MPTPDETWTSHLVQTPKQAEETLALWLLPERLADLVSRTREDATRYEILGIAGLVRSLILDPRTVEALARRRESLPAPVFSYTPFEIRPGRRPGGLHLHLGGEHTLIFATSKPRFIEPTVSTGLKQFLKTPVAQLHEEPVSVKQFIHAYAHVLGGVHLGLPKSPHEQLLQSMVATLGEHSMHWSRALQYIAVVTHRALSPLIETPHETQKTPTQPEG